MLINHEEDEEVDEEEEEQKNEPILLYIFFRFLFFFCLNYATKLSRVKDLQHLFAHHLTTTTKKLKLK